MLGVRDPTPRDPHALDITILNWQPPGEAFWAAMSAAPAERRLRVRAELWLSDDEYCLFLDTYAPDPSRSHTPGCPQHKDDGR